MKKKLIILFTTLTIVVASIVTAFILINNNRDTDTKPPQPTFGVWWWSDSLDKNTNLNFAKGNGINEIYYCSDDFDENTANFIKSSNDLGIKVYWLAGEYQWLDDATNLHEQISWYIDFQNTYNYDFSGIHLDIEPHQTPDFDERRSELITNLALLARDLKIQYPNISFDYDVPFWLEDVININDVEKPAYEFMIDFSDRVFLLSYRDTYEGIYNVAKDEIDYALSVNKKIILSVETQEGEADKVTFFEEGKQVMNAVLKELKEKQPKNVEYSIHHMKSWYNLKP